jgi:glycosyltransferase involved in cell wall biosynthesis
MKHKVSALINLLPYSPGYSGFSTYTRLLIPYLKGGYLILNDKSPFYEITKRPKLPDKLPCSRRIRLYHRLSFAQHALKFDDLYSKESLYKEYNCVYSPYTDYFFKLAKIPQIITVHDLTPLYKYNSVGAHLRYKYITPYHLAQATKIIAISRFVADQLISFGVQRSKIEVIYNGIPKESILSGYHPRDDGLGHFIAIARHDVNKNLVYLAQGYNKFRNLKKGCEIPQLYIVGRHGPQTSTLRKMIKEFDLTQHIRLIGEIDSSKLNELITKSIALLSASTYEGFNYTILEAQSKGVPTLISAIPCHHELYAESSLFFPLDDEGEIMGHHLDNLSHDQLLRTDLSVRGIRLSYNYTIEEQALSINRLISCYQ